MGSEAMNSSTSAPSIWGVALPVILQVFEVPLQKPDAGSISVTATVNFGGATMNSDLLFRTCQVSQVYWARREQVVAVLVEWVACAGPVAGELEMKPINCSRFQRIRYLHVSQYRESAKRVVGCIFIFLA